MTRLQTLGFAIAVGALASSPALADQTFDWSFTNTQGAVEASGTLTVDTADGGGFDVVALTGSVNDAAAGIVGAITGFSPGAGVANGFAWDNVVYTATTPRLDNLGVLFDVGGTVVNIYNDTGGCCAVVYPGVYPLGDALQGTNDGVYTPLDTGTFNIAAPEPTTWALMLTGFLGLGVALRSRRTRALA